MAKYSVSIYGRGRTKYGPTAENSADYVVRFSAITNWYNSIQLSWGGLTESEENAPITYWKIVRSTSGVPDHPDLAETVISGEYRDGGVSTGSIVGMGNGSYLDNIVTARYPDLEFRLQSIQGLNLFPIGTQMTYSLWGYDELEWRLLGYDHAMVVSGSGQTLYKLLRSLPGSWTTSGPIGYVTGEPEENDLSIFLSGFAFYYDLLRTKTYALSRVSDHTLIPVQILEGAISNYGFVREPALGDSYHRTLYRNGDYINAYKGTATGVSAYISALTHWGSEINLGNNLMMDSDDASFEYSVGSWSGPITQRNYADFTTTSNVFSEEVDSPYDTLILQRTDGYYTGTLGFASVQLQTGGVATLTCGESNPVTLGIPVNPGNTYEFSVYCRRAADSTHHAVDIKLGIKFYNKYGVIDSTYTTVGSEEAVNLTWTRHKVVSAAIPSTADIQYATVSINFVDGSHNKHVFLDMFSFGISGTQDQYQDARKAMITLYGEKENLIPNPGFDNGSSGWYVENSLDGNEIVPFETAEAHFGDYVGKVVAAGTDPLTVTSAWIPTLPNRTITFSAYLTNVQLTERSAKVKFIFSLPQNQSLQLVSGGEFTADPYTVESEEFVIDDLTAGRISLTAQTPEESIFGIYPSVRVSIIFTDTVEDDEFYIDSCLLDYHGTVRTFFQGDGAKLPANAAVEDFIELDDVRWESGLTVNYAQNPTFSVDNAGWTNVTRIDADEDYGQVTAGNTASTTAYFAESFRCGSSVTASVFVKGTSGSKYTLTLSGAGVVDSVSKTFVVSGTDWVRLAVTATAFDSPVTFSIASTDASNWSIDKAQIEVGEYATKYVGPEIGGTDLVTGTNGVNTVYMWKYWGYKDAGRSYYFTKFFNKITRLNDTLERYLPMYTDFEIIYGDDYYRRLNNVSPFVKEYSFENCLEGWTGEDTDVLYRNLVVPPDYSVEGIAYAVAGVTSAGTYSMISPFIKVSPNTTYHLSAAVRNTAGDDVFLKVYRYVDGTETPVPLEATVTTTGNSVWSYIAIKDTDGADIFTTSDNLFIKIEIGSTTLETTGSETHVDRVILRPY